MDLSTDMNIAKIEQHLETWLCEISPNNIEWTIHSNLQPPSTLNITISMFLVNKNPNAKILEQTLGINAHDNPENIKQKFLSSWQSINLKFHKKD